LLSILLIVTVRHLQIVTSIVTLLLATYFSTYGKKQNRHTGGLAEDTGLSSVTLSTEGMKRISKKSVSDTVNFAWYRFKMFWADLEPVSAV
jgi:hypothetical protein